MRYLSLSPIRSVFRRVAGKWTTTGLVVCLISMLLLLSAWNTGENLLYIIFGGSLGLLVISSVSGRMNLSGLDISVDMAPAVHRGDPLPAHVELRSRRGLLSAFSVRVILEGDAVEPTVAHVLRVPPRARAMVDLDLYFKRRGEHRLDSCRLRSAFPFGFYTREKRFVLANRVLVYPRVYPVSITPFERGMGAMVRARRNDEEGDEYFSLREYQPGDDIRRIVWRVSARLGTLVVREMGLGTLKTVIILIDDCGIRGPEDLERFELAVEYAASLAVAFIHKQYEVGTAAGNTSGIAPARGSLQEHRILEWFARVQPAGQDGEELLLERLARLRSEPARILCVSHRIDPGTLNLPQSCPVISPVEVATNA